MLSDSDIRRQLDEGNVEIEYDGELAIQQSSIDLHLDEVAKLDRDIDYGPIDVADESTYPSTRKRESMVINSGEFLLGSVKEIVDLPNTIVGELRGRSSVGRLGLFIHNAGLIDAGFAGQITLELYNASDRPIRLKEGMRICQLTLTEHETPSTVEYGDDEQSTSGKYDGQMGPTRSRLYEDFDDVEKFTVDTRTYEVVSDE